MLMSDSIECIEIGFSESELILNKFPVVRDLLETAISILLGSKLCTSGLLRYMNMT